MGGRKVTIVFDEVDFAHLEERAKKIGIGRASTLIRHLAVKAIAQETREDDSDHAIISIAVDNRRELEGYVRHKKLGSIATFATFAMGIEMRKHPLTAAQKERVEKSIE